MGKFYQRTICKFYLFTLLYLEVKSEFLISVYFPKEKRSQHLGLIPSINLVLDIFFLVSRVCSYLDSVTHQNQNAKPYDAIPFVKVLNCVPRISKVRLGTQYFLVSCELLIYTFLS